jgi:hypothetical protein
VAEGTLQLQGWTTARRMIFARCLQWGFSGFCAKSRATTELAARLLLLVYNLWVLFVRFIVPHKHAGAKRGRRWFLLIAAIGPFI